MARLIDFPAPNSDTLALTANWDLAIDAGDNIALARSPIAVAQDVASAVRVFRGEMWYDMTQGVPYLDFSPPGSPAQAVVLGERPSIEFMRTKFIAEGLRVPAVQSIQCFLIGPGPARQVGGQLQITDVDGTVVIAQTASLQGNVPWYISAI